MVESIEHDEVLMAIVIYSNYRNEGIEFFSPENFSQQLGYMSRSKGYCIQPHMHIEVKREVTLTNEVLFIKKGKVKVNLFDNNKNFIESRILSKGDVILLAAGGHGFEMLEDSEIIEVKQGPYISDSDKVRFDL